MKGALVDRLAANRVVPMRQCELGHLARWHRQRAGLWIDALEQLGLGLLGDYTIAGRGNQPFPADEVIEQSAQASFRQDEVGVQKDEPMVGHCRAKIGKTAMQCVGQRHPVLLVRRGNEVVETDQLKGTDGSNALNSRMVADAGK